MLAKEPHNSQISHWEVGFVVGYEDRSVSASSSRNESIGSVECDSFPAKARLVLSGSSRRLCGRLQKLKSIYQCLNVFAFVGPRAVMEFRDVHATRSHRMSFRDEVEDELRDLFEPSKVPDEDGRVEEVSAQAEFSVLRVARTHSAAERGSFQWG